MGSVGINRQDTLILLDCMGVKLPKNTKIPDEDLDKRLHQTLDSAQRFPDIVAPISPVNPSNLAKWTSSKPLLDAVSRGNFAEAYENVIKGYNVAARPTSMAKEDTFREVRQIFLAFATHWDQGHKTFALKDKAEEWCIIVVEVFSLGEDLPLFTILYRVVNRPANMSLHEYLGRLFGVFPIVAVSTTDLERKCMLKLFTMNSKRISSGYKLRREKHEAGHTTTFLLPLGPLNMRDLGKLNSNPGCEICGKKDISRCTQCLAASYCSKECQREDWKEHKKTCLSLKGGTWRTLTFSRLNNPTGKGYRAIINRFDSAHDMQKNIQPAELVGPPPNIHDEKAFLVKFQVSLTRLRADASMLLYDRQRSFQVNWVKAEDHEVFMVGEKAMAGNLKIYRWARRVGDYQLSVCFDRAPETDPVW
ncbi:hypothetical protein D9615_006586 [Tricholomella constricta]|uniref:MYND-type domain-containing protein n=1 Tax=Tricholomella constricta TaxID=117010 RepID=A0A8H5H9X8_9AGAR|nr:hypothetical protein D9615_006586 [Tricholomella constricta]